MANPLPDPSSLFSDSYTVGSALMDKVDPASPDTVHLGKEDGEKYLLYVTSSVMKGLHAMTNVVEELITGDRQDERKSSPKGRDYARYVNSSGIQANAKTH